jgi:acetate kinase
MKILVINSGSSSIKFQLLETSSQALICKGLVERIGKQDAILNYNNLREKFKWTRPILNHQDGLKDVLKVMVDSEIGVLKNLQEIEAVGHRIVHGGEKIKNSVVLDDEKIKIIEECNQLAPLHNPANLMGVAAMKELLPEVSHVGVFDTAFHSTMPEESFIYALDYEYYEKHGIRRFGFHGTSHHYVAMRAAKILGRDFDKFNCITCHLGNGVSITAVKNGKSVDTSLGFGTVCGVPMGTRSGDVDPAVILYLLDDLKMNPSQIHDLLYKNSGLKGISYLSNDMREIEDTMHENARCKLAFDIFCHWVKKYIGALATKLEERVDAIIFTAGIGENSPLVREAVCKSLGFMGVRFDASKNDFKGREEIISTPDSLVTVMVVPTNEELMIALETESVIGKNG